MAYQINVGDPVPHFSAKDQTGKSITDKDLLGRMAVLYFYPRDNTPGCTKEACSFRDEMPHFDKTRATVLGISPDDAASHRVFIEEHRLSFPLLCDEQLKMCRSFDVLRENEIEGKKNFTFERTTFIIDEVGLIVWIERPVKVEGHIHRVLEAIRINEE